MVDYPHKRLGLAVSAGLLTALSVTVSALVYAAQRQPFGGQRVALHAMALALLAGMVWIALRTVRLATLRYEIRDGYLCVDMGLTRWQAPLTSVRRIAQPGESPRTSWGWPGWTHVIIRQPDVITYMASTLSQRRSLLIEADGWSLLLSPRNPTAFVQALDQASRASSSDVALSREPLAVAAWPVWRDAAVLYPMAMSLVSALLLYAGAAYIYPALPTQITMIGSAAATRVLVPQDAARAIPTVAGLVALTNGILSILLHRHSRVLARLLVYGALVQQGILWVGLWRLVRG